MGCRCHNDSPEPGLHAPPGSGLPPSGSSLPLLDWTPAAGIRPPAARIETPLQGFCLRCRIETPVDRSRSGGEGRAALCWVGSNAPPRLPTTEMRVHATFVCTTGAISIHASSLSSKPLDPRCFALRFELVPLGLIMSAPPGTTARAS
jgi:hypothetical protein